MKTTSDMTLFEAILGRRAVRAYKSTPVPEALIQRLAGAAAMAPSALNSQPWVFAVIEGRSHLAEYSDRAKRHYLNTFSPGRDPHASLHDQLNEPGFDVFFGAPLAIVIYSLPKGQFSGIDCCLAGQNLMLAAYALGLGTCPVGYAQGWLDLEEVKTELGVPSECTAVLTIAVGYAQEHPIAPSRREPTIVWTNRRAHVGAR